MLNIDEGIAIVEGQEEALLFNHFNRQDVRKPGREMADKILEEGLGLAVSIRLLNGFILFQYAAGGTNTDNTYWLEKKFNTVRDLDASGLHHLKDHDMLVENIARFLRVKDPPRLPLDAGF
jgi:uncharacterized protein (UPF0303 family)